MKIFTIVLFVGLLISTSAAATESEQGVSGAFDQLGGNEALFERAQALSGETQISVVQDRSVNRFKRHEFFPEMGMVLSGNRAIDTHTLGVNYNYHINPLWSVGINYSYYSNELTKDGQRLIDEFMKGDDQDMAIVPQVDYPKQSTTVNVNWYPIYGKINLRRLGVTQFDMYLSAGFGQVDLKSGTSDLVGVGGGMAFWFSPHVTARLDFGLQNYEEQSYQGSQDVRMVRSNLSMGYLL